MKNVVAIHELPLRFSFHVYTISINLDLYQNKGFATILRIFA